jgi:hypothetical protein
MARLTTKRRKKLKKALVRVERKIVMEVRKMLEQQKKWKARLAENNKS